MDTNISTKEILSTVLGATIFFTVFLNALILATNTPMLFLNDGVNPVLTIWTSISFLLLLFSFNKISEIRILISIILMIFQIPSVIQLVIGDPFMTHAFFVPSSSITVSFFFLMALHNLLSVNNRFIAKCLSSYCYFIATFIPIIGLWGNIFQSIAPLTHSSSHSAIGFSGSTLLLTSLVLIITSVTQLKRGHDYLNIKAFFYSFKFFYFQLMGTSILSIPLIKNYSWSAFPAVSVSFLSINFLMLIFAKNWIEKKAKEEKVTICSWNNTIRSDDEQNSQWLSVSEYLNEKGFIVSHGISPEALHERKMSNPSKNQK